MSLFGLVGALGTRRVGSALSIVSARRHRLTKRRGGHTSAQQSPSADTWWGRDPRWFPEGTPPRQRNQVTPLVDGHSYFPALAEALRNARHYVYIVGWCLTPNMPLERRDESEMIQSRLVSLLAEAAGRLPVRILLWSGSPFLFQPTARSVRQLRDVLAKEGHGDMQCRLDHSARVPHCHHQKAIVVDGQVAFVGGMDVTTYLGDRWDEGRHTPRMGLNWHDVQLRIQGEAVADVERNFRQRWSASGGDDDLPHREPVCDPSWRTPVQIVRTIPIGVYPFARGGEFGIYHAYIQALRRARRFVYIENQYLWEPDVLNELLAAIHKQRDEPFRVVIVLPARAEDGKWDNDRHVDRLRAADGGRNIVSVYSLYSSGPGGGKRPFTYKAIYVHAKVAIVDDEWMTVGSANLNHRGLATDSELNVIVHDAKIARALRVELWSEHLGITKEEVERTDPIDLIDQRWVARAEENKAIREQFERPLACHVYRYETGHVPGTSLLEAVEVMTFDL